MSEWMALRRRLKGGATASKKLLWPILRKAHNRRNVVTVTVVLGALSILGMSFVASGRTALADFVGHVSDLPWVHQTWEFGCSWHCDCASGSDDSSCSGTDFLLRSGTLVIAAGNGSLAKATSLSGGLGPNFVEVEHTGGIFSDYAHLTHRFWSSGSSDSMCRFIALGYSGRSNSVDHLHFAGRSIRHGDAGSQQDNKSWAPVHADLATGITLGNPPFTADGSPHSYGTGDFASGHWKEPRDHSGGTTSAYMVDDQQRSEFTLHSSIGSPGGWNRQAHGFGYWGLTVPPGTPPGNAPPAASFTRRYGNSGNPLATFDPNMPAAGNWAVYVFVPTDGGTTTSASYDVIVGSSTSTFVVDQNANFNKWVRLGGARFLTSGTGQGRIRVRLMDRCTDCGDETKHVAADAVLFIPDSCS